MKSLLPWVVKTEFLRDGKDLVASQRQLSVLSVCTWVGVEPHGSP